MSLHPWMLAPGTLWWAGRTSLVVGTVLVFVNQGDTLLRDPLTPRLAARIVLTYAVPFLVSLHVMLRRVPPGE